MSTPTSNDSATALMSLQTAMIENTAVLSQITEQYTDFLALTSGAPSDTASGYAAAQAALPQGLSGLGGLGLLDPLVGSAGVEDPLATGGEQGAGANDAGDDRVAREQKAVSEIQEIWGGLNETLAGLNGERLESEEGLMLAMIGNATKGTKALAKINSAFAIGETIKNTALGVQKAFADTPFPLNIAHAAFIASQGVKNLATIKGQFHAGIASVPATGSYLLERGERVVDRHLNSDLKAYLGAMQKPGAAPAGPTIQMTVNGNPDNETLDRTRESVVSALREAYTERGMLSPI